MTDQPDLAVRNNVLFGVGWGVYVLGYLQVLTVIPAFFFIRGEGMELLLNVSHILLSVLMGLIYLFIGFVFRLKLREEMGKAALASVAYLICAGISFGYVSTGSIRPAPGINYVDPVLLFSTVTLIPVWTGLLAFDEYMLPASRQPTSPLNRYRWLGVLAVFGLVLVGVLMAGNPAVLIDPASIFFVVVPLPFLLMLSGLSPHETVEFFLGILSLGLVSDSSRDRYHQFARRAGWFVVGLGAIGFLIGLVMILVNMDQPDRLGLSAAVSLISLFYGLLLKIIVFDPYAYALSDATRR